MLPIPVAHVDYFDGFIRMAKAIKRNPRNVTAGPITMRRVEKISGLKPPSTELPGPAINMNPTTIKAKQTAMAI